MEVSRLEQSDLCKAANLRDLLYLVTWHGISGFKQKKESLHPREGGK